MGPVVVDRSSRHRVLKWLQHSDSSTTPRSPTVADDCVVRIDSSAGPRPAVDTSQLHVNPAASSLKAATGGGGAGAAAVAATGTPRQRIGQLWKRWKSRALGMMPERSDSSSKPLSPAVLKRHQQLCALQRNSNVSSIPPVPPLDAFSALATPAGALWPPSAAMGPIAAPHQAPNSSCAVGLLPPDTSAQALSPGVVQLPEQQQDVAESPQEDRLARVYDSPFYTSSASKSASPETPKPTRTAADLGLTGAPVLPAVQGQGVSLPLMYSTSADCSSAAMGAGESCSPSATPWGVSALRSSSSFNRTGTRSPSQYEHSGSNHIDTPSHADQQHQQPLLVQYGQYTAGSYSSLSTPVAAAAVHAPAHLASPVLASPVTPLVGNQMPSAQRSALQHSPQMFAGPGHSQLQQLLQAPTQQQTLQQLQPAGISSMFSHGLPAGSALTAYPAVAAAFNSAATTGGFMATSAAAAVPPQPPAHPSVPLGEPVTPTAAAVAVLEASTTPQDVQDWLLRAALLEDELQGRALEAGEALMSLQEKRELFASLASSLQHSTAGSAEHADMLQAAAQSLGLDSRSSLYRASSRAGHALTLRSKMTAEVERLDMQLSALQARAAGLGSALATLQGCQAVLGSSRAARLSPCSRLAILQLVLSDVVARLPDDQLHDAKMLEGLPSLCADGREICALAAARAGSIHASLQPLLLSSPVQQPQQLAEKSASRSYVAVHAASTAAVPGLRSAPAAADAGPQLPSLRVTGLQRQGSVCSVTTTSTATTYTGRPAPAHSYHHNSRPLVPPPSSVASGRSQQVQPQQQQVPWYADLKPEGDGPDEDDDIMDSLSDVLSSRVYTPRLSLSYESRKAAAAAATSRQAAALSHAQASGAIRTVPSGSAAAAGAAALTLAGIASSGSWAQWPPSDGDAGGINSSQHAGVWDMMSVHSPRSATGSHRFGLSIKPPPSISSAGSSHRGGGSKAGYLAGPSGVLQSLSPWPESPVAAVAAAAGHRLDPCITAQDSASSSRSNLLANTHQVVSQYLQMVRNGDAAAASGAGTQESASQIDTQQQQRLPQAAPAAIAVVSCTGSGGQTSHVAQEAHTLPSEAHCSTSSRASSFDSCITARSRFSLDVTGKTLPAASAQRPSRQWMGPEQQRLQPIVHCALPAIFPLDGTPAVALSGVHYAQAGDGIQPRDVTQGAPQRLLQGVTPGQQGVQQGVPQGTVQATEPDAVHVASQGAHQGASRAVPQTGRTAVLAAPPGHVEALGAVSGLLSGALPAGIDINSMTIGELLSVLSAAATQQQHQQHPA